MEQNDLLLRLQQRFPSLSKGQKQIASYIIENYDRAAFVTASKMGRSVGVSESTVVRFAYTMGFDGYPALQRALQEMIRTKLTAMQRIQLTSELDQADVLKSVLKADMHNIRTTIETISNTAFNGAMDALLNKETIYIVGLRSAFPIAQFLAYNLNFICTGVILINGAFSDACEQMARISERDVCIAISYPRYSTRTVDALQYAKERGATTIALTDSEASPLAQFADFALTARSDMASFADSLVAPLSLINAIIVSAGLARKDQLMEHFSKLERIWNANQVYVNKQKAK
ncbi:MAG TPA: MurR/RpiR family transcriptional regulator [Clostridia bacterium]|nr:MAG: HTH-type transcriptional regulator MurR [Firmicutes bacterium ADurb.Bin356]HOF94555.1 MurR/RpiR family transcriptional regulator [Clostridia bacterium]HOR12999.1 MurR/RpiR family transcriptional regulator [Clostridia bacterium]